MKTKRLLALVLAVIMVVTSVNIVATGAEQPKLVNPITGTVQGAGYDENSGHDGIDLYPYNYGDPVYAVASGTIMYSCTRNHTREYQAGDDCCTVKIILDEPITYNGTTYVCACKGTYSRHGGNMHIFSNVYRLRSNT